MNLSVQEILTQAGGFVVLVWIMKKFFWKPLLAALDSRKNKIKNDLEQIESVKKEVDALRSDYQSHLQKIEEEARAKMQEAIQEGRRIAREIQEKARGDSQASFEKAKENIVIEVEKARIELRREVAKLSLQIAEKVVQEKMDAAQHEKKAIELIEALEKKL